MNRCQTAAGALLERCRKNARMRVVRVLRHHLGSDMYYQSLFHEIWLSLTLLAQIVLGGIASLVAVSKFHACIFPIRVVIGVALTVRLSASVISCCFKIDHSNINRGLENEELDI